MQIYEHKPTTRVFSFAPDYDDPHRNRKFGMDVEIDLTNYTLTVRLPLQTFSFHITKRSGDPIADLIEMTTNELVATSTKNQIFREDLSKKQTLRNVEQVCREHQIDITDPIVQNILYEIENHDISRYIGVTDRLAPNQFRSNIAYLLKNTILEPFTDQIVYVKIEHHHVVLNAAEMITEYLFPALKKEIEENADEITKEEILHGLQEGLIEIFNNNADGCISARIGGYWFYFAGSEDENLKADLFLKMYDFDTIADMIHETLNDKQIKGSNGEQSPEWQFYKCALRIQ